MRDFDALARHIIRPDASAASRRLLENLARADVRRAWAALSLRDGAQAPLKGDPLSLANALRLNARLLKDQRRLPKGGRPLLSRVVAAGGRRSLGAPVAPAQASRARKRLSRARAWLKRLWPLQAEQTSRYMREIIIVGKDGFEGTIPELLGVSFFRSGESWFEEKVKPASGAAAEAGLQSDLEFLLHETAHQQLLLLGRAYLLWTSDRRQLVSPWSGVKRSVLAFPAALHAYWITYEGLRRMPGTDRRLAELAPGFKPAFGLARRELALTPYGARFLDLLEAEVRRGLGKVGPSYTA